MKLTKADLIEAAAAATGLSQNVVRRVLNAVIDEIVEAVGRGDEVSLREFMAFGTRTLQGRTYQTPQGGMITKRDRTVPRLHAGRRLTEAADESVL